MEQVNRFNDWLAEKISSMVATMWCAYIFAVLALISLPAAIKGGKATLIAWIAQTFLQLVLLSIIMVGQKVADQKLNRTKNDLDAHRKAMESNHSELANMVRAVHQHLGIKQSAGKSTARLG